MRLNKKLISQIKLQQSVTTVSNESTIIEVEGTVAIDPQDAMIMLFTVDSDSVPTNTLDAVDAVINPLTFNPSNKSLKIEDKVIADCCEALIGAVYLDKGFLQVENFILELWKKNIKESIITQIDAKTKLQEFSLKKFKKLPIYKTFSNTGPRHKPVFKVGVKIINSKFYIAQGNSKKDAEQNAAILCLNNSLKL